MNNLKNSNALRFSYFFVNFAWFSALAGLILIPLLTVLSLTIDSQFIAQGKITFPINTEVILFSAQNTEHFMNVESAMASADLNYVAEHYTGAFIGLSVLVLLAMGIIFYAVNLLRNILRRLRMDQVFVSENIIAIKRIAISILLLSPAEWIYHMILSGPFKDYLQQNQVSIELGSADFGFLVTGLLIYTLSLIFERGFQHYEELKLTV
ncbi:MAG TPA: hypothetical protein DEQ34_02815 [Balneolaceae bacterium]|nr:hypothetical protein [Balneolaceae bacterium]|tara:strand:+ start:39633 stop:40259 length:627 start_codon:yes stop_codon:yes gene_type:complete